MPETDNTFWTALFSMVGGVLVTAITVWGGRKVTKKADTPKNRADSVFDGYDNLIEHQQKQIESLTAENKQLRSERRRWETDPS